MKKLKFLFAIIFFLISKNSFAGLGDGTIEVGAKYNIDATSTASYLVGTTNGAGQSFLPTFYCITYNNINTLITVATISIGSNSSTYNNILSATSLTIGSASGQRICGMISSLSSYITDGTDIYVRVSSAAVATTYNINVFLYGFYF